LQTKNASLFPISVEHPRSLAEDCGKRFDLNYPNHNQGGGLADNSTNAVRNTPRQMLT
jgi:hypothetical protein